MDLLIVEDQEIIRQGLHKIIDGMGLPIDRILEAADGKSALETFRRHRPGIVIADVRMPRMNGLEFIQEAKNQNPSSKFVVLSGHSEFDYAQRAVRLGVTDYLLKPVKKDELKRILLTLVDAVTSQGPRHEGSDGDGMLQQKLGAVQRTIIDGIMQGRFSEEETGHLLGILDRKSTAYHFCVLVCRFEDSDHGLTDRELRRMVELHTEDLNRGSLRHVMADDEHHVVILVGTPEMRVKHLPDPTDMAEACRRYLSALGCTEVVFGIADWARGAASIPALRRDAFEALDLRLLEPGTAVYVHKSTSLDQASQRFPLSRARAVLQAVKEGEEAAIVGSVNEYWQHAVAISSGRPTRLKTTMDELLVYLVSHTCENPALYTEHIDVDAMYSSSNTLAHFRQAMGNAVSALRGRPQQNAPAPTDPVEHVRRMIDANYHKDLSLASLAAEAGMNSNYFCTLFKKRTGTRIVHYVQQKRVDEARLLLADPNLRILDVAMEVGFNDDKYFHKVFKRITGQTPAEYREMLAEGGTPEAALAVPLRATASPNGESG